MAENAQLAADGFAVGGKEQVCHLRSRPQWRTKKKGTNMAAKGTVDQATGEIPWMYFIYWL